MTVKLTENEINIRLNKRGLKIVVFGGTTRSKSTFSCSSGHLFNARTNHVLQGNGCPACVKLSFEDARIRAKTKLNAELLSFNGTDKASTFMCQTGHIFTGVFSAATRSDKSNGCPVCKSRKRFCKYKKMLFEKGFSLISLGDYKNVNSIVSCKNGHVDVYSIANILNDYVSCKMCKTSIEDRVLSFCNINKVTLITTYADRVQVLCTKGHLRDLTCEALIYGNVKSCPECKKLPENLIHERLRGRTIKMTKYGGGVHKKSTFTCLKCDLVWSAITKNVIDGSDCPNCAPYGGFNPAKKSWVYFLLSGCGKYCKVGITNKPKQRIRQLKKSTPFSFTVYKMKQMDGEKCRRFETEMHNKYESVGFSGFSGATEWLFSNDKLLNE